MRSSKLSSPAMIGGLVALGLALALVLFVRSRPGEAHGGQQPAAALKPPAPKSAAYSGVDPRTLRRDEAFQYAWGDSRARIVALLRDEEGNLKADALKALDVSDEQVARIATLYQTARQEMAADFKSRIEEDPRRSDPEKSILAYKVNAAPEAGDKISSRFKAGICALVGAEKTEQICAGFILHEQFGCFGRQEVRFKMIPSPDTELGYQIKVEYYEPQYMIETGTRGITTTKELKLAFGTALDE